MENTRAVRTDGWKYVARHPKGPNELYDMSKDPQERFNLFGQPPQAEKQRELAKQLEQFFVSYNKLRGKKFKLESQSGPKRAMAIVQDGIKAFKKKRG